jgi:CDP-glucose 4,6-dehydratase
MRVYRGKRVLITGHTGFKGAWLATWLLKLGATVYGYALPPPNEPSLYQSLGLAGEITGRHGDICDEIGLREFVRLARPDIVFHLAAVSTVAASLDDPDRAFQVNAGGFANLLSAAQELGTTGSIVCVTSDKCYRPSAAPHRECDQLGFGDPYSASKATVELIVSAYQLQDRLRPLVATARSGNVIGGGDWIRGRLVPDVVRGCLEGGRLGLRNPQAVRPWQHVLDVINGYLILGGELLAGNEKYARPYNFGPAPDQHWRVTDLVNSLVSHLGARVDIFSDNAALKECEDIALLLDSHAAATDLGWTPTWNTQRAAAETAAWYLESYRCNHRKMLDESVRQIDLFSGSGGHRIY